jgi:preprotein translocase subunit SecF
MFVINHKTFFLGLSLFFVVVSFISIALFGLNWGIDFTGGSILEIEYENSRPELSVLEKRLSDEGFIGALVLPTEKKGVIFRTGVLDEGGHARLVAMASTEGTEKVTEKRFSSVGGVIGAEIRSKAWIALFLTLFVIILYIAFAFRKVSDLGETEGAGVSSWKYGLVAVVALLHNIIVPIGVFAALGYFFSEYQIDILFVTALLAIFGFSVNDTIVIFDRVRENLKRNKEDKTKKQFAVVVGESITQTLARSINISFAIAVVLFALYVLGGASTREFSLVLVLGVLFGTYSSICFAAPLLTLFAPSLAVAGKQKHSR